MTALALAHGWMTDLSQAATGSLIAAVWQGMLLTAAAWLGLRLLPKTPAAVRFAIWFGVFLLVTLLPVVALWPHAPVAAQSGGHGAWLNLDSRWSLAIAVVWAVASLVRAATLVLAGFRVRALWQRATPVDIGFATTPLTKAVRGAEVCTSNEVDRPTVIGFFSPRILIPEWLLEKLTAAELEQIVLHESGHLGRADDWMNLLQKIALVLFPLNPTLAWVERRLCFERELACDERVLRATDAPKAYAACLATLAEYRLGRRGLALALGALGRESELGQRVGRILRREKGMKPLHAKLVLSGAMIGLMGAAAGLEHCPQLVGFSVSTNKQVATVRGASGFSYQPVVFHSDLQRGQVWKSIGDAAPQTLKSAKTKVIRPIARGMRDGGSQAPTADQLVASTIDSERPVNNPAGPPVRMVRTNASHVRHLEGDAVVTQWVVVRSWQGEDGSQLVLTTAGTSEGTPKVTPAMQREPIQDFPPYAAVPVRGGWLVFQL